MAYRIVCERCGREADPGHATRQCGDCRAPFTFTYDCPQGPWPPPGNGRSGIWAYASLLPVVEPGNIVSLGEGATPLLPAGKDWGCRLLWKNESQNPTGSQKDRALSVAISKARELKVPRVVIASTGSAGLACAAYCARASVPCLVLVPAGTPPERLHPIAALGAHVAEFAGTFVQLEELLAALDGIPTWYEATTKRAANPYQSEAPKTIAYEVVGQLGGSPDWVVVPVGGGGTLFGIWRGFDDLRRLRQITRVPGIIGVQPAQFNTLEVALRRGLATQRDLDTIRMDERVETVARNLKHGAPPDGADALRAIRDSGGTAMSVTDAEALEWQARLAAEEGIFCEPSSATAAAAVRVLVRSGVIRSTDTVVSIITGSGFRELGTLRPTVSQLSAGAGPGDLDRILPL